MSLRIRILVIGKTRSKFLQAGNAEYLKRLQPYAKAEIVTLAAEKIPPNPAAATVAAIKAAEARTLLAAVTPGEYLIALSPEGEELTSGGFAALLDELALRGESRLAFAVGGTLGLDDTVLKAARRVLSLSRLTFTHELVRLILVEQLYRAFKISRGEPYHY